MAGAASKYDFEGIGKAGALLWFAALKAGAGPVGIWLTTGLPGALVFQIFVMINKKLASLGLVTLNVGIDTVKEMIDKNAYNKTLDDAYAAIHAHPGQLTPAQKKEIDDKVISAYERFVDFGVRKSTIQSPGPESMDHPPG